MSSALPQLEWIKPPRQARSQATLERILDAAETLIGEHGFDAITVAQVARQARSSVGAFYARFADKEALLRGLFERFCEQSAATVEHVLEPGRWGDTPIAVILETAMAFMVRMFRERRLLIASFWSRAGRDAGYASFGDRLGEVIAACCMQLLAVRGIVAQHSEPGTAVRFAVATVLGAVQARTLAPPAHDMADPVLATELTRMCLAYLGIAPGDVPLARDTEQPR